MYCACKEVDEDKLRWIDKFQTLLYSILKLWFRLFALIDPVGVAAKMFSVVKLGVVPAGLVTVFAK